MLATRFLSVTLALLVCVLGCSGKKRSKRSHPRIALAEFAAFLPGTPSEEIKSSVAKLEPKVTLEGGIGSSSIQAHVTHDWFNRVDCRVDNESGRVNECGFWFKDEILSLPNIERFADAFEKLAPALGHREKTIENKLLGTFGMYKFPDGGYRNNYMVLGWSNDGKKLEFVSFTIGYSLDYSERKVIAPREIMKTLVTGSFPKPAPAG